MTELHYPVILRNHKTLRITVCFKSGVVNWIKREAKFGDGFKKGELFFASTCVLLFKINSSLQTIDKK